MPEIGRSLRHALRQLRRAPLFSMTAVTTLALGIGACSLMFSILSTVLFKPLAFREPGRIAMIWGYLPQVNLGFEEQPIHGRHYRLMRENARAFSSIAAFRARAINLGDGANPERLDGIETTGGFFEALGVGASMGRFYTEAEETPGRDRVVVLSDALWRRRFNADPAIVGQSLALDGEPYTVIGVAPSGFGFPRGAEMPGSFQLPPQAEIWVPIAPPTRGPTDMAVVARLGPGITLSAATEDLARMTRLMEEAMPQGKGYFDTRAVPMQTQLQAGVAPMLWSLLAAAGLVLLVSCVNVAQLFLSQVQRRRRDLAIRAALGASSARRMMELCIEVFVLVTAAGAIGTGLGAGGVRLVRAFGSNRLPRLAELSFDGTTAIAAVLVTLVAALLAGIAPALVSGRVELAEALRRAGRGSLGSSDRLRRSMIVTELALSVVLVASAGLLVKSLTNQLSQSTGFAMPHGVTFELTLPPVAYPEKQFTTYKEHPAAVPLFTDLLSRLRAIPGVQAAGLGKPLPLSGAQEATSFVPEGFQPQPDDAGAPIAEYTVVSAGLMHALGTAMAAGRDFDSGDTEESLPVVIVNQAMARSLWPGEVAVGKRIKLGGPQTVAPWMTVIGVTEDVKRYSLTDTPRPEMLVPYTQKPYPSFNTMQFAVRSSQALTDLIPAIRQAVAQADPTLPVSHLRTMLDLVQESSANARFAARFMSAFGVTALMLALIGLYGVIAYGVQQRTQEFGLRRALGASPSNIIRMVVREGLLLAFIGLMTGIAGAIAAGGLLKHLLYQTSPVDPLTFVGVGLLLTSTTAVACLLPARRASRVEPRVALEEG
jgi:putative ABC transport system permease protein